ncbi:MAG: hypothetical protein EON59_03030 [Alphaproteobacteria bacterium]|nr:MAG: hypothetical protein EON59_03030 [Alphaproteobacteria bacterium]
MEGGIPTLPETKRSEHRVGSIADDPSPVFTASTIGPDHRFVSANTAYKRLVGREDLIGRPVAEVMPEFCVQGFIGLLDHVFATGEPYVGTAMPIALDIEGNGRSIRHVTFANRPVRDHAGRVTGIFCEGYDATAERLAADQLAALRTEVIHLSRVNAMSMMATTIAHELNQPLAAIRNYAGGGLRLLDRRDADDAMAEAFQGIDEAAERASEIISNVRLLVRRGETARSAFNLNKAVAECIRLVLAGATPSAAIDNAVPVALIALADRVQIQQVLINLLRNAVEASDGSAVVVSAVLDGSGIIVSVSDKGTGLSPAAVADMFEWTTSAKEHGMGLGLSISRTIIESHGGSIWLARTDASGSEFCFSIPASMAADAANAHG